ncbi:MAG: transposase [Bacillota bacterium]|nr:transposase [Bacillota bacterium]
MIKTIKVMLLSNNKQRTKLFACAGAARFAYNWALAYEKDNHLNGGHFLSDGQLRKKLTKLKETDKFKWLNNYSNNITKQAVKDACTAYCSFFKKQCKFPRFKSRKKSKPSFYVDTAKVQFSGTHVKLEKLTNSRKTNKQKFNWIKLSEKNRIPLKSKYINPRVTFDGINWWISVGIEVSDNIELPQNDGIGIDFGLKKLAVCSDENTYENVNETYEIKRLRKKQRRLQRRISKKYLVNKEGDSYCKTSNIIKSERKLLKLNHRLSGIRHNYLHQITSEIVKRKPSFILVEDLNVNGMMKNKHMSRAVQEQCIYEFYRQLKYKTDWNNIKFIEAPRFYPSSKLCCVCGNIKPDLKLRDRVYHCSCGNIIDRDYQASVNLYNYGKGTA